MMSPLGVLSRWPAHRPAARHLRDGTTVQQAAEAVGRDARLLTERTVYFSLSSRPLLSFSFGPTSRREGGSRVRLGTALWILFSVLSVSADASDGIEVPGVSRRVSVVFGFGNSVGGLGGGAEAYLAHSRLSVFGGIGYVPSSRDGRGASGVAVAAGARLFAGGQRQQNFPRSLRIFSWCFDCTRR